MDGGDDGGDARALDAVVGAGHPVLAVAVGQHLQPPWRSSGTYQRVASADHKGQHPISMHAWYSLSTMHAWYSLSTMHAWYSLSTACTFSGVEHTTRRVWALCSN